MHPSDHNLALLAQQTLNPGYLALGAIIFILIGVAFFIYFNLRKPKL